jgi:aminoglycoside phosphotransferase (APT) family kinase protein
MHVVLVGDGLDRTAQLILRRYVVPEWNAREPRLADEEAEVLRWLDGRCSWPATPELVAVDGSGEHCGAPAVLMTRLRGRPRTRLQDLPEFVRRLAAPLPAIHSLPLPPAGRVRSYRPHSLGLELRPPVWSARQALWERAVDVYRRPVPRAAPVLLHRDYHSGNVLWVGERLSGVVDWVLASVGPPDADVGHCRFNLARRFGQAVADRFLRCYGEAAGRPVADYDPYWDVVAVVGALPDFAPSGPATAARLDRFVAAALA